MENPCIFCKFIDKEIKTDIVYEDDFVLAFRDIDPKAPIHILIIPKKHIQTVMEIGDEDKEYVWAMWQASKKIAELENVQDKGFRVVTNCGKHGGQEVDHLHFHFLAGRQLTWPPG